MYSNKIKDEFIYNNNRDIALRLSTKTIFAGRNNHMVDQYPHFEIWLMTTKGCKFETDSASFELKEDDVLIFSQNDSKNIVKADSNAVVLCLQIDSIYFGEFLPINSVFNEYDFFAYHSPSFKNKISSVHPVAEDIKEMLIKMADCFTQKNQGYETEVLLLTLNTLMSVVRDTNYLGENDIADSAETNLKKNKSIKKAIDYIDAHLNDELTLERISAVAELSPNYFSNIFREQTGVKLWDYISEKRVLLATNLLIEYPNDSVISIALKCGFNNCPNFNRAFKKYTGQTPKKYKTSILRQEANYDRNK